MHLVMSTGSRLKALIDCKIKCKSIKTSLLSFVACLKFGDYDKKIFLKLVNKLCEHEVLCKFAVKSIFSL